MKKFAQLKRFFSPAETAKQFSMWFEDEVTEADVIQQVLDGQLTLSIHFVNHTLARKGKIVPLSKAPRKIIPSINGKEPEEIMLGKVLNGRDVLHFPDKKLETISGICDLPMIGCEVFNVQDYYQRLTGGPPVTLWSMDGALVSSHDGTIYQLQIQVRKPNYLDAWLYAKSAASSQSAAGSSKVFRDKIDVRAFSALPFYIPASRLPRDGVFVVRAEVIREFLRRHLHQQEASDQHGGRGIYRSKKLAFMNQAAARFWENADPEDRTTHPTNTEVAAWLEKHGFSATLADKAASLVRPEWAPTGRKPEE